jgi:hypothetical protein
VFKQHKTWVVVFVALCLVFLYVYQEWFEARAWQMAVHVPIAGFQPGTVRLVQGLWITNQPNGEFYVFQNRSSFYPDRTLRWVDKDSQFEEPISSARYGIEGVGQFGPAGRLYRVESRRDGENLLALPTRIVSGGPGTPAWLVNLKHFFGRLRPNPPSPRPSHSLRLLYHHAETRPPGGGPRLSVVRLESTFSRRYLARILIDLAPALHGPCIRSAP